MKKSLHAHTGGKLEIARTTPLENPRDLSIAYTPGVAEVSMAIHADRAAAQDYTWTHGRLP